MTTATEYAAEIARLTDGHPDALSDRVALVCFGVDGLRAIDAARDAWRAASLQVVKHASESQSGLGPSGAV